MKGILLILMVLSGISCKPERLYELTHYHIIAAYDPATTLLSANVQIVFVPGRKYQDSIVFKLNENVEILALTAQELKYYEFNKGRLILYIEEAVLPGDQLHISMNYKGLIGNDPYGVRDLGPVRILGPDQVWYPVSTDIEKLTYSIEMEIPDPYRSMGSVDSNRRTWQISTEKPMGSITIPLGIEK